MMKLQLYVALFFLLLSNLSIAQNGIHFDPDFDFSISYKNVKYKSGYQQTYLPGYPIKLGNQLTPDNLSTRINYSFAVGEESLTTGNEYIYKPRIEGFDKDYYLTNNVMTQHQPIQMTAVQYDTDYANYMLNNQYVTQMDLNRCPTEVVLDGAFDSILTLLSKLKK